jgi:hypothetical protein
MLLCINSNILLNLNWKVKQKEASSTQNKYSIKNDFLQQIYFFNLSKTKTRLLSFQELVLLFYSST